MCVRDNVLHRKKRILALALVWVLTISCIAPFLGASVSAQETTTRLDTMETSMSVDSAAPIDPALTDADGPVTVVVRLEEANPDVTADRATTLETLQTHAERSQRPVLSYAKRHANSVTVLNRLWITNAVVLRVDTSDADLKELATIDGVTRLHKNFELTLPKPTDSGGDETPVGLYDADKSVGGTNYNTTYGLDQINATDVWDDYGTRGDGVKVAVLDTGVDVDHPDIELYTENESDPTYPGGWAEFDGDGNRVQGSVPHDTDTHGTHTSGTVSGGNASGEYIGVAPDVELMHGLILPSGSGSFTQVAAGMQWAVEQDADVISMSLGATGYYSQMIEPVRNAESAGTIVVAAAGNSGEGTSGSPGNVYESFAVGASNEDLGIASFSSGEEIDTENDWGSDAPASWPDSYVVPDVAAPGADVKSSVPGGGYSRYDGTSMATPHTAGAAALMIAAAGGDLQPSDIRSAFRETAFKPENCSPSCSPRDGNDTRYGAGIIDVKAATDTVALENGITGTVTDESGAPVDGATVSLDTGRTTETNASGGYTLLEEPGTYDVTASAFGYGTTTSTVTVENGSFARQDFSLSPALGVRIIDGQPDAIEGGESVTVTADVRNLETYTVELDGDYETNNATLVVNGEEHAFGEAIDLGGYSGELTVTVETTSGTHGSFSLSHTFEGTNDSVAATTGPTEIFEEYTTIAVVDSDDGFGEQTADALDGSLPANYQVAVVQDENAMEAVGEYDSFVIQDFDPAQLDAQAFVDATNSPSTGVVWLEQWGDNSNGITGRSAAVGDPASTADEGFGAGNPYFTITESSPLFEGVGSVGDQVTIHTGSWGDHAWYDGYSGQTVATVGDDDGTKGSAIGVDRQTGTVLASSLGRTSYVENGDYTEEADAILANAVQYVSTAPAVIVKSGQPRHVNTGEEVEVNLSVNQLRDVQVDLSENSTLSEDDLTLYIDGWGPIPFGLPILERPPATTDEYTIRVVPDENAVGSFSLETTATAGPDAERVTVRTGPTAVYDAPINVPEDVGSVQEAVDLAPPGAEIVVGSGTYTEQVTVDTPGVTIRGADGATPVIAAPENATGDTIAVDAPDVTVNGVTVDAGGRTSGLSVDGADNATVRGVTVRNATTGISVDTANGAVVDGNVVRNASVGIDANAPGATVTDNRIEDAATGLRFGNGNDAATPTEVRKNEVAAETGVGIEGANATAVSLRFNDFESTDIAVASTADATFDARLNYFGDRGPADTTFDGDVAYEPFLTARPENVDTDAPTKIGIDLDMPATAGDGRATYYTVGIPGPTDQTVGDILGSFDGTVYGYDAAAGQWEQLTADSSVDALDALLVGTTTDARGMLTFEHTQGPPSPPGQATLVEGWNFVAAPQYAGADEAFGVSSGSPTLVQEYATQPTSQLGPRSELSGTYELGSSNPGPNVSAFTGYYVYSESAGTLPTYLTSNPTMAELYDGLNIPTDDRGLPVTDVSATMTDAVSPTDVSVDANGAAVEPLPTLPMTVHGTVTVDGEPASAGTTVTVDVGGETRGTFTVGENGTLGAASGTAKKLVVSGTADDAGEPVTFSVDGTTAATDSSVTWKPGAVESVHLTVKSGSAARTSDDSTDSEKEKKGKKKAKRTLTPLSA